MESRRTRSVTWIVATLSGAVALLWLAAWTRSAPDASLHERVAALEVEMAALRADAARGADPGARIASADPSTWLDEIADLRSEIDQLRDESRGPSPRPRPKAQARSADRVAEPLPDETAHSALVRELDDRLRVEAGGAEARDWEDDLRARIRPILPPGAELRALDCRISLCRVELSYPDQASYVSFVDEHLDGDDDSLWPGATFLHVDSDDEGPLVVSAYLALELQ